MRGPIGLATLPRARLITTVVAAACLHAPAVPAGDGSANLAEHVRAARWGEVGSAAAAYTPPWPPEVALVAARAERHLGRPARARELLRTALPQAGGLAPALRLEAAEAALALGQDPWPVVQPLLTARADAAQRRAVAQVLRRAWEELPVSVLTAYHGRPLPRTLRRWRDAVIATRTSDTRLALRVLADRHDDGPAARAATFLRTRSALSPADRLLVGQALLATGFWREAEGWFSQQPQPEEAGQRHQLAFLHARALYRLGRIGEAAAVFQVALATATTPAERHAAAVQRARCGELLGDWEAAGVAWDIARRADPTAPAGWEGVARAAITRGATEGVCSPLASAPAAARRVAAERTAAVLLARSQGEAARVCLAHAEPGSARARLLGALAERMAGHHEEAQRRIATLLADPASGTWREVALILPPLPPVPAGGEPQAARDVRHLTELAARCGPGPARSALAAALKSDPAWAGVVSGAPPVPPALPPAVRALLRVGLEREAARLFAAQFPVSLPAAAAWSASALAAWDNSPAALRAGERVWQALGGVPAGLVPEVVTRAVLPPDMVAPVALAASAAQVSPALLAAIVRQESRFDASALSPAGARGVAQLVPETARRLGASEEDLWRPDLSLELAAKELARLQEVFGARPAVIAAAYNAGDAVVANWLAVLGEDCDEVTFTAAIPYQETSTYVRAVLEGVNLAGHLRGS